MASNFSQITEFSGYGPFLWFSNMHNIQPALNSINEKKKFVDIDPFKVMQFAGEAEVALMAANIPKSKRAGAKYEIIQAFKSLNPEVGARIRASIHLTRRKKHWALSSISCSSWSETDRQQSALQLSTNQLQDSIKFYFARLGVKSFNFRDLLGVSFDEMLESREYQNHCQAVEAEAKMRSRERLAEVRARDYELHGTS